MNDIGDMLVDANNEGYKEGVKDANARIEPLIRQIHDLVWEQAYQQGRADAEKELKEKYLDADAYNEGLADGRADAIDECIVKVAGLLAYYEELTLEQLYKTNVENELHFLMNDLEQLKE